MERFDDIKQNTKEWHNLRYAKVGGSTSKQLHTKTDTLLTELIGMRLEEFVYVPERFISADIERGNLLEPIALKELIKYTFIEFRETGWMQSKEIPLIGISPDGITEDNRFSCEIKCPGRKKYTETILKDEIPLDNIHQCLHYFVINPFLEKHFFASFRPENKIKPLFVKELTKDSIINLGTIKKPQLLTIKEWVEIAKQHAKELQISIDESIKQLEF